MSKLPKEVPTEPDSFGDEDSLKAASTSFKRLSDPIPDNNSGSRNDSRSGSGLEKSDSKDEELSLNADTYMMNLQKKLSNLDEPNNIINFM